MPEEIITAPNENAGAAAGKPAGTPRVLSVDLAALAAIVFVTLLHERIEHNCLLI